MLLLESIVSYETNGRDLEDILYYARDNVFEAKMYKGSSAFSSPASPRAHWRPLVNKECLPPMESSISSLLAFQKARQPK